MTQKEFNEIIQQCKQINPNFLNKATWRFQICEEFDSIDISASIKVNIFIEKICNTTSFSEQATTKNDRDSIINTIMALNDNLLQEIQTNNIVNFDTK